MRILILAVVVAATAGAASAQSIETACLRSERDGKSRQLCSCIQDAANLTLTNRDQKLAVSFYGDPQKAQDVRQSPRRVHRVFWKRYKDYAEIAETFCG